MAPDPREVAFSATELFCETRVPEEHSDEVLVECSRRGNSITIVERRPPWDPERMAPEWSSLKVAQLRWDPATRRWSLYCRDSNERWWPYDQVAPSPSVDPLLAEIDADPTGIFWG